jgi:hypothetical protein
MSIVSIIWNKPTGQHLTIIRRRRGDYRGIFTETKSRSVASWGFFHSSIIVYIYTWYIVTLSIQWQASHDNWSCYANKPVHLNNAKTCIACIDLMLLCAFCIVVLHAIFLGKLSEANTCTLCVPIFISLGTLNYINQQIRHLLHDPIPYANVPLYIVGTSLIM